MAPVAMMDCMYSRDRAMDCTHELLQASQIPDAIFIGNDHMAFAVIDVLRAAGLVPGRDISVVGCDDVPLAAWGAHDPTTLRQPLNRMIAATVDTLLGQIDDPASPSRRVEIDGPPILRGSARVPQGWTA
jgi:DNA-binding LacI/PurR family transcriptional regulator